MVHTDAPSSRAPGRSRTATVGVSSVVRSVRLVLQDGFDRQQFRFAVAAVARVSCRRFDGIFEADRASGSADALLFATAVVVAGDGHCHAGKIRLRVHSKVASRQCSTLCFLCVRYGFYIIYAAIRGLLLLLARREVEIVSRPRWNASIMQ